jgi:hypothetical protein
MALKQHHKGWKVYVYGVKKLCLWDERSTSMGWKVYVYGMKGLRLWDGLKDIHKYLILNNKNRQGMLGYYWKVYVYGMASLSIRFYSVRCYVYRKIDFDRLIYNLL